MTWKQLHTTEFDLCLTMASGQFFRYYEENGVYTLVTERKVIRVKQQGALLFYEGTTEQHLRILFQLLPSSAEAMQYLTSDPVLAPILSKYNGLKVMRIDLHETILGFICSSASNIPKIRMNLHLLSQLHGEPLQEHWCLPQPGVALDQYLLSQAKTGYRAKYLAQTNSMLTKEFLIQLRSLSYEGSHALLCALPGIGPKIADCICLFGLGHGEAFPVDVHIFRIMRALFPRARLTKEAKAKVFAQKRWGVHAGLAQQFLFQWARDERTMLMKKKVLVR